MSRVPTAWLAGLLLYILFATCSHTADTPPVSSVNYSPPDTLPTLTATAPPRDTPTAVALPTITPRAETPAAPARLPDKDRQQDPVSPAVGQDDSDLEQLALSPVTYVLDLDFVDAAYGWAFGHSLYCGHEHLCPIALSATTDGGKTWQALPAPDTVQAGSIVPGGVQALRFASRRHGWLFGPGLFATSDGGLTWTDQQPEGEIIALEPAGDAVWAIERLCSNTRRSTCELRLLVATITEQVWQPADMQPALQGEGGQLVRADERQAWIIHEGGIAATGDGGQSWQALPPHPCTDMRITELAAHDGRLWLLCNGAAADGWMAKYLYTSADGGESWHLLAAAPLKPGAELDNLPTFGYPNDLAIASAERAFIALVMDTLYGTADGGTTWQPVIPQQESSPGESGVSHVLFADEQHGWALAGDMLFGTTDGGTTWQIIAQAPLGKVAPRPTRTPTSRNS